MQTENQEVLTKFVVTQLAKQKNPDDIVREIASSGQMDWKAADRFVKSVKASHKTEINRGGAPMLLFMSGLFVLVGLAGAFTIAFFTLKGVIIYFITFPVPYLGNAIYFLLGVMTFLGGLVGFVKTMNGLRSQE